MSPECKKEIKPRITSRYLIDRWNSDEPIPEHLCDAVDSFRMLEASFGDRFSQDERNDIRLAYYLTLELTGNPNKMRNDGHSLPWHAVSVATKTFRLGGNRDEVITALLHDTAEDTTIMEPKDVIQLITELFNEDISRYVDALTKVRSKKLDRTNILQTHEKILRLLEINPRIGAIKTGGDRIDFMETRESMTPADRLKKAYETLKVLVPLAHGLGLRDIEFSLANSALADISEFVFEGTLQPRVPVEEYEKVKKRFEKKCKGLREGLYDEHASQIRIPWLWDGVRLQQLDLELLRELPHAWLPLYVPFVIPTDPKGENQQYIWAAKAMEILMYLEDQKVLKNSVIDQFNEERRSQRSNIRIDMEVDGVPVRLIFLTDQEHCRWQASVMDTDSADSVVREAARERVGNLIDTYKSLTRLSMDVRQQDLINILMNGTKRIITTEMRTIVVPGQATAFDVGFLLSNGEHDFSGIVHIDGERVDPGYVIPEGRVIEVVYNGRSQKNRLQAEWVSYAKSPMVRRALLERMTAKLQYELLSNERYINETTLAYALKKRGASVLERLFTLLAKEEGLPVSKLLLPIEIAPIVQSSDPEVEFPFLDIGSPVAEDLNVKVSGILIRIGLAAKGYRVDEARTGFPWRLAHELVALQKKAPYAYIDIPNREGTEHICESVLRKHGLPLASILLETLQHITGSGRLHITLIPDERTFTKLAKMGGWDALISEMQGKIDIMHKQIPERNKSHVNIQIP